MYTTEDGRIFPEHDGKPLSWSLSLTLQDEQEGCPRLRAVVKAFREYRPEQLEKERRELVKGSFDRLFGHNARKVLEIIETV